MPRVRTSSGRRFSVALTHHTCHKYRDPPAGACALTGGSLAGDRPPVWVRYHRSLRLPCVSNDQGGALPLGERPRVRGIACATHRSGPATSRPVLPLELCQGGLPLGVPGEGIRSRCTVRERRGSIRLHRSAQHQTKSDTMSDHRFRLTLKGTETSPTTTPPSSLMPSCMATMLARKAMAVCFGSTVRK